LSCAGVIAAESGESLAWGTVCVIWIGEGVL
jgi:hypothetical protein